jgi:hypothetical protein
LKRARRGWREFLADENRTLSAGRRKLHHPKAIPGGDVGIQPSAQLFVKVFSPIDIRDGYHHNFEFHVHGLTRHCA